ncbi:MAG: hypothetical protein MUC95_05595 [Spirochaetes bacterium]|nr:hypothetical protein [Spirochaetota bacterium]
MELKGMRMDRLNLCQPDNRKGCSACCGLLNLVDISKKNLSEFLAAFEKRKYVSSSFDAAWAEKFKVRDASVHICPYQGFIDRGKPGCMVLRELNAENGRDKSIFGSSVCGDFLCPAHAILEDEYRRILFGYVDDWYPVADPESFIWIVDNVKRLSKIDFTDYSISENTAVKEAIRSAVAIHTEFLNNYKGPIFQYSVSEYALYKDLFTLNSCLEGSQIRRESVVRAIERIINL